MGKLITQTSALGGTNYKMIRHVDMGNYQDWNSICSGQFAGSSAYSKLNVYEKDAYGWPYNNGYQIGYSLMDSHNNLSTNTFYTGSPTNEASVTYPNGSSMQDWTTLSGYANGYISSTEGPRIVNLDEVRQAKLFDGSMTQATASQTMDFYGNMTNYAPSIFMRIYSINKQSGTNNLKAWLPNLSKILIFIDRLGTSPGFCQNWAGHSSLSNPLRIPIADLAVEFTFKSYTGTPSYSGGWWCNPDEHAFCLWNNIQHLPNSTPFYVVIMFVHSIVSGRSLKLKVGYNNGGDGQMFTNQYLTLKASKITYGNYMFDESSGSTTVEGYSWGGEVSSNIDVESNNPWSSLSFSDGYTDSGNVTKQDTGGWT